MYIKVKQDFVHNGKQRKVGDVFYTARAKKLIEQGKAEQVDYEKHHKDNVSGSSVHITDDNK